MKIKLSYEAKLWAITLGYIGAAIAISYAMYKWFAAMVGKSVAKELIKAGIIVIAH